MPGLLKSFHVSIHLVVDDTNGGSSEPKQWEPNHDLSSEAETFWPDETQLKHDKSSTARVERCSHVPECG